MPFTDTPPAGPTRANWRQAPWQREAFRHVDALLPCATVAHDPTHVRPLLAPRRPRRDLLLNNVLLPKTGTDGFVVLADGEIVAERYAHGNGPQTPHILMSATKSVIGLLLELLQRAGLLDADRPVDAIVPELAATPWAGMPLRRLTDMRSLVRLDAAQQRAYDAATNWEAEPPADGSGLHAFFAGVRGEASTADGPFAYISANVDLAGWVIERATGRPVADLLSEWIWQPLGAQQPALLTLDAAGAPRCTGGLCATARDLARLGQWLLDDERAGLLDALCTRGDRQAWTQGEWGAAFGPISRDMSYRSGWYVRHDAPLTLFAMGIHGQGLFVDRVNRVVVAKTSSWSVPQDNLALWLTHSAVLPRARRLAAKSR